MTKTPKRPKVKKIKRNPIARALGTAKYRPRVVPKPGAYKRPAKVQVDEDETN